MLDQQDGNAQPVADVDDQVAELAGVRMGKRMFEKSQADARRLRIRRVAAMSISVSEVCTLYS